jgi:hypothetical protein
MAKPAPRRSSRRLLVATVVAAAIVLAVLYLRCRGGLGLGGGAVEGIDRRPEVRPAVDAAVARCQLRLARDGLTVDGRPASADEALTACRAAGAADVVVTGDARQGDWEALRAALEAGGVAPFVRGGPGPTDAGP